MDDRTLLERAAEAAELPERGWMAETFMYVKDDTFTVWNPLTDDGDALRLAVKLGFAIRYPANIEVCVTIRGIVMIEAFLPQHDRYAATRRAIVRAAAALAGD